MKKTFFTAVFAMAALSVSAQLEVDSIGSITLTPNLRNIKNMVKIGTESNSATYYDHANVYSAVTAQTYGFNVAIVGDALDFSRGSMTRNVGLLGITGNSGSGYSYGVWGDVTNGRGAGIYGTSGSNPNNIPIYGTYAGYFEGSTKVNGTFTATNIALPLHNENAEDFEYLGEEGTLEHLTMLNPIRYRINEREVDEEHERIHFGLTADDIEAMFPNLVYKEQEGGKSINYIELIPVLIQSIKELKEEVDELRGIEKSKSKMQSATDIDIIDTHGNILYQNTPNPFKESTTIRFQLADDVRDACICIFDMQGKMLKKYNVGTNDSQLTINAFELGEGMFLYSLIVDGKEIDTKRMILTK